MTKQLGKKENKIESFIDIYIISNPRTPEGGWKDETGCDICGKISSAYIGIQEKGNMVMAVCKGCLLKGIELIDKDLLNQAKRRI